MAKDRTSLSDTAAGHVSACVSHRRAAPQSEDAAGICSPEGCHSHRFDILHHSVAADTNVMRLPGD